jgi:hypothetical protein
MLFRAFNEYWARGAMDSLGNLYFPTWTSFLLFLILFVCVVHYSSDAAQISSLLSLHTWRARISDRDGGLTHEGVMTAYAGLVAVTFALIIFVSESIRDSKHREQRRVLLSASALWPLALCSVLALLSFLFLAVTKISVLVVLALGVATIFSFSRVVRILLDPDLLARARTKLLKGRIKSVITASIHQRIANNELLSKIGEDREIKFKYAFSPSWIGRDEEGYLFVTSAKEGRISDINLVALADLFNYLDQQAKRLGFSLYRKNAGQAETARQDVPVRVAKERESEAGRPVYVLKRYGQWLRPSSIFDRENAAAVFALPGEFGQNSVVVHEVEAAIPRIFRFDKKEEASAAVRREFQATKDQLASAINSSSLGAISELKAEYLQLAETFLEVLQEFGGGYSAEQANRERSSLFERWTEIDWLRDDLRELLGIAIKTNNIDVLSDIAYLPIAISLRAASVGDHLLFRDFLSFATYVYNLSKSLPQGEVKNYLVDRSWRYVKELSDYTIQPKLQGRDGTSAETIDSYRDFALYTLKIYQSLLWSAYHRDEQAERPRDFAAFKEFLQALNRAYETFLENSQRRSVLSRRHRLAGEVSEQNQAIQAAVERSASDLVLGKDEVRWGLASRIFDLYRLRADLRAELQPFLDLIAEFLPTDLPRLLEVFGASRDSRTYEFWGWNEWEMVADGRAHWVDTHGKVDRLFVVQALKIVSSLTDDRLARLRLPTSRELAEAAVGGASVQSIIDDIDAHPDGWQPLLSAEQLGNTNRLRTVLARIKDEQDLHDAEDVRNAPLSQDKKIEFTNNIVEGFQQIIRLRPLFLKLKALEDRTGEPVPENLFAYGINQLDDKAAFITDYHVSYLNWGEGYGEGMGRSEDEQVFLKLAHSAAVQIEVDAVEIKSRLEEQIDRLKGRDLVIIQSLSIDDEQASFDENPSFTRDYRQDCPPTEFNDCTGFMGTYQHNGTVVPVFDLFVNKEEARNKVIVADIFRLARWDQYDAMVDRQGWEILGPLWFRLVDLSTDAQRRQALLDKQPDWLKKEERPVEYLREKVIVELYERLALTVKDADEAACLNVRQVHEPKDD